MTCRTAALGGWIVQDTKRAGRFSASWRCDQAVMWAMPIRI